MFFLYYLVRLDDNIDIKYMIRDVLFSHGILYVLNRGIFTAYVQIKRRVFNNKENYSLEKNLSELLFHLKTF